MGCSLSLQSKPFQYLNFRMQADDIAHDIMAVSYLLGSIGVIRKNKKAERVSTEHVSTREFTESSLMNRRELPSALFLPNDAHRQL